MENLYFAVLGLLTKNLRVENINSIGDDEVFSTMELIEVMCETMGRKAHICWIPHGLMEGCAKVSTWLHLPLNQERLRKLTENYVMSNEKLKRALGVERMPVDAHEGLKRTIRSFE